MKKALLALTLTLLAGASAFSGQVGLPAERLALPAQQGSYLVCIWDQTAGNWYAPFSSYDNKGTYTFQVPAWGRWYWIGLWDTAKSKYVFGKWVGHFVTD